MANIFLIGYRGTGKTVVGKKLSKKLNRKLIGTDKSIIEKVGMQIPEIIEKYGWDKFRDIESEIVREVCKLDNYIIDTGGGVILRKENVDNMKKSGIIILLKADVETIVNRIKYSTQRPPITDKKSFVEEVEEVLNQRNEKYEDAADYFVDTSKLTMDEVVTEIISYLKSKNVLK